jgi:hypothetical protein
MIRGTRSSISRDPRYINRYPDREKDVFILASFASIDRGLWHAFKEAVRKNHSNVVDVISCLMDIYVQDRNIQIVSAEKQKSAESSPKEPQKKK